MGNLTPEEIARNGAINAENIAKLAGEQAKDYGKRQWYPSVDADGNLTWEKSKSDAKPRSVNIRGPQGTSGITGEVPDLTVVNSLDGGESEPGSVKVLAAEQGRVLKELIDKKPGKIVEGGEIFNHESNTINSGGVNNHAEGQGTTCNGSCNHSEGRNTQTFGVGSHSEGDGTVAGGNASHSEGMGTATAVVAGHVEGKYNAVTDSIHIVGGGTSEDDRKNLHEIELDGSQYMIGVGGYDGTNRDDSKSLQESLTELDDKLGESITESYTSSPKAAWHFNGKLPKSKFFARYNNTSGDIINLRIFADGKDINQTLAKEWKYFDLSDYNSIRVYTEISENSDITIEILEESVLLNFANEEINKIKNDQTKLDQSINVVTSFLEKSALPFILAGTMGKYLCYGYLENGDDIKVVVNNEVNNNICIWKFPCKVGQKIVYRGLAYWNGLVFVNNEGEKTVILDSYNASSSGDYEYEVQEDGLLYSWSVVAYGDRLNYPFIYVKDEESILLRILDMYSSIGAISDLNTRLESLEDNLIVYTEITEPKTWESKTTYNNVRPFSVNITDYILGGISPSDIIVEFNMENRTVNSIFIEYGSLLGGNKVKNQVPLLLSTEGNKNFYRLPLPELSDLAISGDLTKYIVICQISGDATEETPHKVNLTNFSYKEYLATSLEELDKRVEVLEQTSNDSLDTAINYAWRGYDTMKHVTVKKDGSGDFTTIQDAINSIKDASPSNQYDVQVWDDFYITDLKDLYKSNGVKNTEDNPTSNVMLFKMKNWVHVRGMGRRRVLSIVSPDSLAGNSFQYIQVIYPEGNNILANFYICIKGGRYAIHHESGGSKTSQDYHSTTIFKDVVAEHFGNSSYTNGSSWTSTYAQANGTTSGTNWIYERCTWIAHEKEPFYTHENMNFDEPCKLTFIGCQMVSLKNGVTIAKIANGIYFGDLGSNVLSMATIIGCNFKGFQSFCYGNTRGFETERISDDIRIGGCTLSGYGNNKMAVNSTYKNTLTFKTTSNNKNVKVVGGSAYDLLWGEDFKVYQGSSNAPGYAIGIRKIVDFDSKWGSKSTNVYSLAARLGNCQSEPKTLTIEVDDEEHTINFNNNYMTENGSEYTIYSAPFKNHTEIIDEINQQLSEVGVICYTVGEIEYKYFDDSEEIGINKTGATIPVGKFLVRDMSNGYNAWKLATSQNSPKEIEGFSAERIDANQMGRVILTKHCYFHKSGGLNKLYSISDNSNLVITEDITKASFRSVDTSVVEFVE